MKLFASFIHNSGNCLNVGSATDDIFKIAFKSLNYALIVIYSFSHFKSKLIAMQFNEITSHA